MNKFMSLTECLNTLSKEQMNNLYREFEIQNTNKLLSEEQKQEIASRILVLYRTVCITFTSEEEKQIKNIIDDKNITNISPRLLDSFFIFKINIDNENKYIVPSEIIDLYKSTTTPKMKKEKEMLVVSFYLQVTGAIHIDKLYDLVKGTKIDITKKKIMKHLEEDGFILENDVVYIDLLPKELNIYEISKNNEYKQYSLEEIFFTKIEEFEDKFEEKISNVLSTYTENNNEMANAIINMITVGYDFNETINNYLKEENIKLTKKDEEKFHSLVRQIYLKTPSWEFNGFTPAEILNEDSDNIEYTKKLEYIHAYMLINGAMKIDTMLELLDKEHNIKITRKELKNMVSIMEDLSILNNYVVVRGITRDILKVLTTSKDLHMTYKVIENIEEIIKEDNNNVFKLEEICNKYNLNEEIRDSIFSMMNFGTFNQSMLDAILNTFNIKMNNDKKQNLFKKLDSIYKNIRIWTLNGYKESEMNIRNTSNKIGRNDKCSCGSGKKYKHCCGK